MDNASQPTLTVVDAREDEKEAKVTNDLSIPETSDVEIRVKAEKDRDIWLGLARTEPNMVVADHFVKMAKDVAKEYGIPMPELSSVGMREKTEKEIDSMMKKARNECNVMGALAIADRARGMARQYDLSILELSIDDIKRISQREILKRASPGKIPPPRIAGPAPRAPSVPLSK
jgi:hypothetical protein